ncbi:DMP19 family protein [Thiobacillus sp.]|uniref:DMP19 family protein n=1 Tax=Thiobacillus sp. TaxID=924 RepID=UPI0025E5E15E|nr:DMP19 family protein [Thiobacillus sp.]
MDKNAYLIELSEGGQTSFGRIDLREQSEEQQVFSAIWELESQVNNGGFAQYFSSADGHTAHFAVAALKRIGASRCADIVARALRTATSGALPDEQTTRVQIINDLNQQAQEVLESLDQEFFSYPDNLTELLFEFVRCKPQFFGAIGDE